MDSTTDKHHKLKITGKILVVFLVWIIFYTIVYNMKDMKRYEIPRFPLISTSLDYTNLKSLLQERCDFVTKYSGLFNPYDTKKVNVVKNLCANNTDVRKSIVSILWLLPNNCVGYYPIYPPLDPNTMTFRFGQGISEWDFLYSTSYDPVTKNNSSFFCYIMRLDILPPKMLKDNKLGEGDASYYNIALGVGINGAWERAPLIVCRGTYISTSISTFSFTSLDIDNGAVSWSSSLNGEFALQFSFTSTNQKICNFNGTLQAIRPPFNAGVGGCMPCIAGVGTLYTSYTQLLVNSTINLDASSAIQTNAIGWIDHQWINTQINELPIKLIANLSSASRGLGRYMWLNLHVTDNLQYMVNVHPKVSPTKGSKFSGADILTNRYPQNNIPQYNVETTVEVLNTVMISNTEYPTIYKLHIESEVYILDSTPFGTCVTYDLSGSDHWDGSGLLYDYANNLIGTCFLEASQLQDMNEYNTVKYEVCGVDTKNDSTTLNTLNSTKLPFSQLLPTYIFFLVLIIAFIFTIWLIYRIVKN